MAQYSSSVSKTSTAAARAAAAKGGFLQSLTRRDPANTKMSSKALLFVLQNMTSLIENGLSVPKAINLMAREPSLKKYAPMLDSIRKKIEAGQTLSSSLAQFPRSFDKLMCHEIKTAEQAGTVAETMGSIAVQLEYKLELKSNIIKKLSMPVMTLLAGIGAVIIIMFFVVPQFRATFEKSNVQLPLSTRTLIASADFVKAYGWMVLLGGIGGVIGLVRARRIPHIAFRMDQWILRIPIVGNLFRDMAVLQFVSVISRMMGSGFKLVDALGAAVDSVGNAVMRQAIGELKVAVSRGEKLSTQLEKYDTLFPAVISQLVIIGEQTGNLAKATKNVSRHLSQAVERKIDRLVALIEPLMTMGLVFAVGGIMLAIYEPMFAMLQTIE